MQLFSQKSLVGDVVGLLATKPTPLTSFACGEDNCDTLLGLKTTPDKGRMSSLRELMAIQNGDGVSSKTPNGSGKMYFSTGPNYPLLHSGPLNRFPCFRAR